MHRPQNSCFRSLTAWTWNTTGRLVSMFRGNPASPMVDLKYFSGKHTHCSAFVAAAAERVGIYVLRPPEHKQILLANAQYDWLASDGAARGWQPVADAMAAQHYANQGWLVLAAYKNHHDDKPGHIAIVRASDKDARAVREEGPQLTQAGATNYRSVALRVGFQGTLRPGNTMRWCTTRIRLTPLRSAPRDRAEPVTRHENGDAVSNPADWNRVEAALDEILALPIEERQAAIARIAGGNAPMRVELESLLHYVAGGDELLDGAAVDAITTAEPLGHLTAGQIVGAYQIVSLLGRGGMGEVYKAERIGVDFRQIVALKLLRSDAVGSIERFQAERQILAELNHPGIARLLDGGITPNGRPYMAMEFVDGHDLMHHCIAQRSTLQQRLALFDQVCEAVAYAHSHWSSIGTSSPTTSW